MNDLTFDQIAAEPQLYVEQWKDLTLDELNEKLDEFISRARDDLELESEGDPEELSRLQADFDPFSATIKSQIISQIENTREKEEPEQEPEPITPKVSDPLSPLNAIPFNNVKAEKCIYEKVNNVIIDDYNDTPKGFKVFEMTAVQSTKKTDYFININFNNVIYQANYINFIKDDECNFTDDLMLIFAVDKNQFLERIKAKGITDYRVVDFKKINEADAKEREEYNQFRKGIDFTITGNVMDKELLLFIGECITSDAVRYSDLINKYYNNMDDDIEKRNNHATGLKDIITKINDKDSKIDFERFNKTVINATIESLKRLKSSNPFKDEQDDNIRAEKTERLESIIRDYYLNNLKFSKVLADVRQKITDEAVNKQGAKR